MHIKDIATVRVNAERGRTWLFVEVSTDTGEVGIGECSQSRFDAGVELLVQEMKSRLVGRHPMDLIEPLRMKLLHDPFADRTRYAAFSGIEQALWDLAGKSVGQPVHRLLGGTHTDRVRLYANINAAKQGDSPEDLADKTEVRTLVRNATKQTGAPRKITVEPNASVMVSWPARVEADGRAKVTFRASGGVEVCKLLRRRAGDCRSKADFELAVFQNRPRREVDGLEACFTGDDTARRGGFGRDIEVKRELVSDRVTEAGRWWR